jgi:hypothetical protein
VEEDRDEVMRLWTLHPRYLDAQGLVALWRESLLALAVLRGETRGYRHHPQLSRFREQPEPLAVIAAYLRGVRDESLVRGYRFDGALIPEARLVAPLSETEGQLLYEWGHLREKLRVRSPASFEKCVAVEMPLAHPLFEIGPGPVAAWERSSVGRIAPR